MKKNDMKKYLGFFILLMLRGFTVSLNPVHGTESEFGSSRIKAHMRKPFLVYIIYEVLRNNLSLSLEAKKFILKFCFLSIKSRYSYYIESIYLTLVKK